MKKENVVQELEIRNYRNGSYIYLEWVSEVILNGVKYIKRCWGIFRLGCSYAHIIGKEEVEERKGFKRDEDKVFNKYIAKGKNGDILMVYSTKHHKTHSIFESFNGGKYTKQELIDNGLAREEDFKKSNGPLITFNLGLDKLVKVGN